MGYFVKSSVKGASDLRPSLSLRWRLQLFLGTMFLVTLLLIGSGVYYFVSTYEQRIWQQRQAEAAHDAAETIGNYILAMKDALRLLDLLGLDELRRDPTVLNALLQTNADMQEVIFFDQHGDIVAQAARGEKVLTELADFPSRWLTIAQTGAFVLSQQQPPAATSPYLVMVLPAAERGALVARLDLGFLNRTVAELRLGAHGQTYLLNQAGDLIAYAGVATPSVTLTTMAPVAAIRQTARPTWQGIYVNQQGIQVIGIALPITGTDWLLINELAAVDALDVSRTALFWLTWGMALFAVLVMIAVNSFLRRSIIRPLESLQAIAQRIGQGDLTQRIPDQRRDEVGAVVATFNQMLDQLESREEALHKTRDELEARVQERTAELRDSVARIKLIADNVPALIAYVDDKEYYRFVNKRFENWYIKTELVDRHLRDVAGEGGYENIAPFVQAALAGQETTFEYSRVYPDGQLRHVQINYIPHFSPERQVMGFFTLVQDLTAHKTAEEQIKASLAEKDVLLKEIHHRVKNNLQVISSLLYLQADKIIDAQLRTILQDSQSRVKSMALIHEKLYQAKDLARVNLSEYIRNLVSYLLRAHNSQSNQVRLRVDADQIALGIDTAMPCGLIINELVSNALKHAFPNGRDGEIHISLQALGAERFCLTICDNGIGFPGEIDFQNTSSLGLQLVNTLVQQLDGSIKLRRDSGTMFEIQFSEMP